MTVLTRSLHTTDEQLDTGSQPGRELRRTIRNWANFRTPAGLWLPSFPGLREHEAGLGRRGFRLCQLDAPLQAFVSDGGALGLRDSRSLARWATLTPVGTDPRAQPVVDGERIAWPGLWRHAELSWTVAANRVEKLITLARPGHPAAFRFGLDLGPGQRARVVAGRLYVGDDRGSWLWTQPAWAADALGRPVRVGVRLDGTTLVIEPSADDLRRAVYPVRVDPTATISGTTAVDDNMLNGQYGQYNYGASTLLGWWNNGTYKWKSILRVATASLPAGTHTALRMKLYFQVGGGNDAIACYFVADANATWPEGTGTPTIQVGSSCWNNRVYSATNWAGSAGLSTSGTDYDADASPPTFTTNSAGGLVTATLRAAWSQAWKDATRANGGILTTPSASASQDNANSSEASSNKPTFEVDYTVTGPAAPILAYLRRRSRS